MTSESFKRPAVICVGRIYCDLIFTGLDSLAQPGREVFAQGLSVAAGGGVFISAAHLVNASRAVALVARLGTDDLSRAIERELNLEGLDLRFLERAADAGPQVTVASVIGGDRAFLSHRAGPALPANLDAALNWQDAGHLHIAEYATLHEARDLVSRARAARLSVSLDPSWDDALIRDPLLLQSSDGVELFLPNLEEAAAITGETDPQAALALLARHFPVVALKGGARGAWARAGEQEIHVPAPVVPVVDTTGAGDAFNAGFIDSWLEGGDLTAALMAGVQAGSLAVQATGGTASLRSSLQQAV